jgi:thiol:disulfide interchange protein DsbC
VKQVGVAVGLLMLAQGVWADANALEQRLKQNLPPATQISVKDTPINGLYEVSTDGQVFYLSEDGRYAIQGQILDLQTRQNLTEPAKQAARVQLLKKLQPDEVITYPAQGQKKREVWVFDDIDCPYCSKLHKIFPKLQTAGITIHVLFFPRGGLGSKSYFDAVKVWCSKDRRQAFDIAMETGQVPDAGVCRHPVSEHLALAQKIGVTGTPYMVLDNGEIIPGYIPPSKLIPYLTDH